MTLATERGEATKALRFVELQGFARVRGTSLGEVKVGGGRQGLS